MYRGRVVSPELIVSRGAEIRRVDDQGAHVDDITDTQQILRANLGDRLLVAAADLDRDEVAAVEVVAIGEVTWREQRYGVAVRAGSLPEGDVWVMGISGRSRGKGRK